MTAPDAGGQHIGIRIDGRLHTGTYQEAAEIIRQQADADALDQQAQKSRKAAKVVARSAAQKLKARLAIVDPIGVDGVDTEVVADRMFRDLRDVYSKRLIDSLLASNLEKRQADDQAAITAAEALIYG